ncbi:MAG TPA: hypothetical protein PLH02_00550 [Bacillota bacterium]|nr:hypothetical protein [Bacillota bacterium]HPF42123.1 hypothetical protein [Bacillota bacterium]HPJ85350.1 hypothetical protein [Bacillota bacterium]HPQ61354.1 hypothetical protein [Bacillota bacterium]HRX91412.1 hypothetical protein [Candidatus Izemoplasmatales bacterium]
MLKEKTFDISNFQQKGSGNDRRSLSINRGRSAFLLAMVPLGLI